MVQTELDEARLDAEELMHLALKAMGQGRDDDVLLLLKRALSQEPENGRLHYLLGALHAELGMTERAIKEMMRATQLSPELGTAHFQLGLLHMARADFAQAQAAWEPLDQLEEDDALRLFKQGMVKFLNQEYEDGIALLKRGIALGEAGKALNNNMERVIEQIQAGMAEQATTTTGEVRVAPKPLPKGKPEKQQAGTGPQHVLLAGYSKESDKSR